MSFIKKLMNPYKGLPREIYIIFISRIINSMGTFVFPLLSLILTQKVGFTKAQSGIFVALLLVTQIPSLLIGGRLADKLGRKKVIPAFQGLGALCYIFCGLIKPSMIMAIFIVLASCFYGMASPAFEAVTADLTTPKNRKESFSLLYMGHNIGFAMAPIVGGLLYKKHLPLIFLIDGLTTVLSLALFVIFIKETMKKKEDVEAEIIENVEGNLQENHEEGSVFKVLLKRPILLYFAAIMFVYSFSYVQWGFTLPLQLGDKFGKDGARLYGMIAGFNGIVVILFTPIITSIIRKVKPMKAIAYGGVLYAIAFGMLALINHYYLYFVFVFILTIGEILISINSGTFIANNSPASHRGRINAVIPMITGTGFAMGPVVMSIVVTYYGYYVTWIIISILVLFAAIFMGVLNRKNRVKKTKVNI